VLLEEAGLAATLDWYIPTVERQTGLAVHYQKSGAEFPVEDRGGRAFVSRGAGELEQRKSACGNEGSVGAIDLRAARVDAGD